jgi:endonuclease/exonuclease/phosphatase family metal-dependent hydrolase
MFILMFLYYSRYEWPAMWPVLAALVAIPALRSGTARRSPVPAVAAVAVIVVGVAAIVAGSIPTRPAAHPAQLPAELRLLDYNIHMGFDAFGLPDPAGIAAAIAEARADVVALQEVGRGWTVNGGADLFAWLRWRFPEYRAVYGPMNGALWGNALLIRHPVTAEGSVRFPLRESPFRRGLTWARVPASAGELLIIATHFAHEVTADHDRLEQAGDLLAFWRGRPRTVVMGDLNAGPDSAPVTRLEASGLRNALAPFGLASAPTYPSPAPAERIDYVLLTTDLEPVAGGIPRTTASDHLPVIVQIRVP